MTEKNKTWKLMEILNWSTDYLSAKGIEDAKTTVEWLLCETLSFNRMDLYLKFDRPMSESELAVFRPMLLKCASHQPVQQVVGSCEFYGLKLAVNDKVLIPRPETERLVEVCIREAQLLSKEKNAEMRQEKSADDNKEKSGEDRENQEAAVFTPKPKLRILDIGSGSGCIAIALAMHIPNAEIVALEKSADAIEVLKRNILFHNLEKRVRILQMDIKDYHPEKPFDIIVSNPPYIAESELPDLNKNVSHYEPYMALSDSGDGLGFYRFFAVHFRNWLQHRGFALLEFGGNAQRAAVGEIFAEYETTMIRDYQQDDRVILIRKKKGVS